jgi:hypothetical protein
MDAHRSPATRLTCGLVVTLLAGALLASTGGPAAGTGAPASARESVRGAAGQSSFAPAQARRRHPGHYRVASFNVLGFSHTTRGQHGMAGGRVRMVYTKQLLNRHSVQVVGFQELQVPQVRTFQRITHGNWGLYPEFRLQARDSENSIGWRRSKFRLVRATTVNIPYFDGERRAMPIVLLRDRRTGMLTYFTNFHNPAETARHRNQGRWRLRASAIEIALHRQLVNRGIPRIMTGDMNERAAYFCRVTRDGTPLHAARPRSVRTAEGCSSGRPPFVDWIFGSLRVEFRNYFEAFGPLTKKTSDHPMVMADVTVRPAQMPRGWQVGTPSPFVPRRSY